jgi:hypothetical protein
MAEPLIESREWWRGQRKRYNIGLIVAGLLAFVLYVGVVEFFQQDKRMADLEITLFTIIFQGVGYLIMMLIANLFFNLGAVAESILDPTNPDRFRTITFNLGFWFSVALPFLIPGLLVLMLIATPQ